MPPDADNWNEARAHVYATLDRHDREIREQGAIVSRLSESVAEIKASNRTWGIVVSLVVAIATLIQVFVKV